VPADEYERQYAQLLDDTRKAWPQVKLILCEPFGLPVGGKKDNWPSYYSQLLERQAIVNKLGARCHACVVHFQKVFEKAATVAPAEYWIWDGVHPTYSGHQLMADEWVRAVREAGL
jgi:lysophospholipase L1-like esterase